MRTNVKKNIDLRTPTPPIGGSRRWRARLPSPPRWAAEMAEAVPQSVLALLLGDCCAAVTSLKIWHFPATGKQLEQNPGLLTDLKQLADLESAPDGVGRDLGRSGQILLCTRSDLGRSAQILDPIWGRSGHILRYNENHLVQTCPHPNNDLVQIWAGHLEAPERCWADLSTLSLGSAQSWAGTFGPVLTIRGRSAHTLAGIWADLGRYPGRVEIMAGLPTFWPGSGQIRADAPDAFSAVVQICPHVM
eukprot:gene7906-biopygen15122